MSVLLSPLTRRICTTWINCGRDEEIRVRYGRHHRIVLPQKRLKNHWVKNQFVRKSVFVMDVNKTKVFRASQQRYSSCFRKYKKITNGIMWQFFLIFLWIRLFLITHNPCWLVIIAINYSRNPTVNSHASLSSGVQSLRSLLGLTWML